MENGNENENLLNRIRALLAKAESTDFPAEAETYTAKAMELVSKYGIDQTLLEARAKTSVIGDRIFKIYAPYATDKVLFFNAIINTLGGKGIRLNRPKGVPNPGYEEMHVFATETDLARIDLLFTSLLVQCANAMNYAVNNTASGRAKPRKFKSDFLFGFTVEVATRLHAAERKAAKDAESAAEAQGMSTALVLVRKEEQVAKRVSEVYENLQNNNRRRTSIGPGYGHGAAAGRKADLGGERLGNSTKQGALAR